MTHCAAPPLWYTKQVNILFVGSIRSTDTSLHYYNALVRLGNRALSYDPAFFEARGTLEKIETKIRKGPTRAKLDQTHRELLQIISANRWDLIFVMGQNFISLPTLVESRKKAGDQARFVFHSHDNLFSNGILKGDDFFQTLEHYDCVFTTKSQNVALYKSLGQERSFFLPSAYEPLVHRPVRNTESRVGRQIPVSFIGTYDLSRNEVVKTIGWDKMEVWGDGWERYSAFRENQHRIHPKAVYYFEFADITSHSQISLGLLRKEAQDRHTQRTFEIPACGSFQIAPRTAEILTFFDEGKEIHCFDSAEELKSKVDYFLAHETECKRIAEAGFRRVVAGKHTYEDRVQQILDAAFEKTLSESA
jgi:spore maturation protein CgeB